MTDNFSVDMLKQLVNKIENLEGDKEAVQIDLREVYNEAKSLGFNIKVLRKLIVERKKNPQEIVEFDMELETYKRALGM